MELRWTTPGDADALVAASDLFDHPVTAEGAAAFLARAGHHLCLAYDDDGEPAGFVSGVETTHPDKGTEMFLYELGVREESRGRGIGAALVVALAERARALGCYAMWVLTDDDNDAALATYRRAGAAAASSHMMLEWELPTP